MKKLLLLPTIILSAVLFFVSCSKEDSPSTPEKEGPSILSFTPLFGEVGETIWITGKNFGSTSSANTVKIGSVVAPISSSSTTEIFVTVPEGAVSGAISVTVDGETDTAGTFTVVQEAEPIADNISLDKETLELNTNDITTLVPTITGETNSSIVWTSDNTEILTVNNQGDLSALQSGSATITATIDGKTATCAVTINPNIYTIGFESEGDADIVKLWTNGADEELMDAGDASDVFVSGTDIYIAGQDKNDQAAIWKNGTITTLTTNATYAEARSVFVLGSDVYATGHDDDGDSDVALVWKNGQLLYELTDGTTSARAYSIFVDEPDIYVAGYESNDSQNNVAKIWRNGMELHILSDEANNAETRSVFVSNSDVYASGQEDVNSEYVAKIWKNGAATDLTDGTNYSDSREVFVVDTDVYTISEESTLNGDIIKVWKNSAVLYELTNGDNLASAQGLFVIGTDVYVAGYENEGNRTIAKVWKNEEVLYELNSNGSKLARAYSIYAK